MTNENIEYIAKSQRQIANWLLFIVFMVFLMVIVGGATRLTESGLSMVTWKPVSGIIPPMSEIAWLAEFANYKESPQYKIDNLGMSLDAFKSIFWWEWGHRLLGRLIGFVFLLPLVWFWVKNMIPSGFKPRLLILFVLGGAQGLLGWYMVKSGLIDEPAVSHYRLTAHLSLALVILAYAFWTALDLLKPKPEKTYKPLKILTHITMLLLVLQILMGGLVAGLKAGFIFNTWPLMGDSFVPQHLLGYDPWYLSFIDSAVTTQFDHRIGAYLLIIMAGLLVWKARNSEVSVAVKNAVWLVAATFLAQVVLGIVTLVSEVPVGLGTAHQGGGVVTLVSLVYLMHIQRREA